jgi:predicted TIM-barrel fold metal-dependent hydrolase
VFCLAGCGSDRLSKDDYEQKVRSEYADVQQAFLATRGAAGDQLAARIEHAQGELREAADGLEERAPEEVEEENEGLVEGMREYAKELDELREAAENEDQQAIEAFNERIPENDAVEQIAEAAEEMKFKGYDLGAIAEE